MSEIPIDESAVAEIAEPVRELLVLAANGFPGTADITEICKWIRPYVRRAVFKAQMAEAMRHGTFPRVLELVHQIDQIGHEIDARSWREK